MGKTRDGDFSFAFPVKSCPHCDHTERVMSGVHLYGACHRDICCSAYLYESLSVNKYHEWNLQPFNVPPPSMIHLGSRELF